MSPAAVILAIIFFLVLTPIGLNETRDGVGSVATTFAQIARYRSGITYPARRRDTTVIYEKMF